ncbi:hypothetical protein NUKP76_10160 [Klebsiella variicola]|nr:hypothetical protein NUKP76_10160 [Klebsiella variicola]
MRVGWYYTMEAYKVVLVCSSEPQKIRIMSPGIPTPYSKSLNLPPERVEGDYSKTSDSSL